MITLPVRHIIRQNNSNPLQYNIGRIPPDSRQDFTGYCSICCESCQPYYEINIILSANHLYYKFPVNTLPKIKRCTTCYARIMQSTTAARKCVGWASVAFRAILNDDLARVIAHLLVALKCAQFIDGQS